MKRRLLVWVLFVAACIAVAFNTRFTADMSAFLPAKPNAAQQLLVDQLRHGPVSRLLLLGIETSTPPLRAPLSQSLAERLRASGQFASVENGAQQTGGADQALLFRYRYLLGDAVDAGRFTSDGLRNAITDSLDLIASPAGFAFKDLLVRDPGGEIIRLVERLEPDQTPASADGVWVSGDGKRALLLVQLKEDGTELDRQQAALASVRRAFEAARREIAPANGSASLIISGAARFAVESRDRIRGDVERLSGIGTLLIIVLLGAVYRSPRLLLLGLVPVATGALASIAAVSLAFGEVHGITLGFGVALIGEAIDYAIYVFLQGHQPRLWRTLRLGVLTSLIGFSALLFSGFPGLAQLGLFAITGILTASVVTWALLGPMFATAPVNVPAGVLAILQRLLTVLRRWRWVPIAAIVAATTVLVLSAGIAGRSLWQADLAALSPIGEASKALDASLRAELKAPDMRHVIAVSAADAQQALAGAQRASDRLRPLIDRGVITGFDSPARLLPDQATQLRRRAALPDEATLRRIAAEASSGTPLRVERLQPFFDDVAAARQLPPLQPKDLAGTTLGLGLDALLVSGPSSGPSRTTAILPLRSAPAAANGQQATDTIDAAAVQAALAGDPSLHLIDIKAETDALYGDYLDEAIGLSAAGVALIVLMIGVMQSRRSGSPQISPLQKAGTAATRRRAGWSSTLVRLGRVILPIAAAICCVIAGLAAAGVGLTLLHLVGLLLTVAVGSNYALFFVDDDDDADPRLLASLALANTTTVIGFGILGFASVPVLAAVGQTVGPGAVLCLLFSAMISGSRRTAHWTPSPLIRASIALHVVAIGIVAGVLALAFGTGAFGTGVLAGRWPVSAGALLAGVAAGLIANHLVLTLAGLWPRSRLLGPNLTRLPATAIRRKQIAITIDDGPDPDVTPRVLDCLRDAGARASFFLIADRAERHPELVARIVREGHDVENHTDRHSHRFAFSGPAALRNEIARAQLRLCRLTGRPPMFFRAPAGLRNPLLDPVLVELGLRLASWTRRGYDTVRSDPDGVLRRLVGDGTGRLAAGDILLLHDGNAALTADRRPVVLAVLPDLLAACRRSGLQPVTLREATGSDEAATPNECPETNSQDTAIVTTDSRQT